MATVDLREREADRAAARGDLRAAEQMLAALAAAEPDRAGVWLKLAGVRRAQRDLDGALDAVSGALKLDPLAFMPLLMKATLLDALGRTGEAGEIYGAALFHAPPDSELPPPVRAQLDRARERQAAHVAEQSARLAAAQRSVALSGAEARKLERFRSNILRTTRVFHSEPTHFHFPGLAEREFHDREAFPWLAELEAATDAIRDDFRRVLTAERAELVPYVQYPDDVPLAQWKALNRSRDWTAIHLVRNGEVVEANARHCPAAMAVLGHLDQPRIPRRSPNAMFSLLAPGAHIPPHVGVANTRLVVHLPLIVPAGCWFRVGAETRDWREGEAWVFDDTIEHEAKNESAELRVIFIVDTWHPGLSPAEREAVAAVMAASDGPGDIGL